MGEVNRARDTRLIRDVAIKVLPESFPEDHERVTRFEREARLLATFNHPNIASVYGLEEVESRSYLVMELVEGKTLGERLKKGRIQLEEMLEICRQIALQQPGLPLRVRAARGERRKPVHRLCSIPEKSCYSSHARQKSPGQTRVVDMKQLIRRS